MKNTPIQWTDHSLNFWWGCVKVSPGCEHCYAETLSNRYKRAVWGPAKTTPRWRTTGPWRDVLAWDRQAAKKGVRQRVFCQSMSDFFEEHPQLDAWRLDAFDILESLQWLDVQLLTKRPENITRMVPWSWVSGQWPEHVWIGTSVEDQKRADERIPHLIRIPAAVRFVSIEPLLGPVDLTSIEWPNTAGHRVDVLRGGYWNKAGILFGGPSAGYGEPKGGFTSHSDMPGVIDWVITGAESGHGARTMNLDDARSLRDQCAAAGVKFFMKQVAVNGRKLPFDQFPEDLQIREFPR